MNDKIQKANGVLLGVFVACGLGLTAANVRKAIADSSGGSSTNGCQQYIGSASCSFRTAYPKERMGTACGTANNYDCCLYDHWKVYCYDYNQASDGSDSSTLSVHSYLVLIGPNADKVCKDNRCVAPSSGGSSSGGSSSGGSSSGGSSSGGSSYASNSGYYFQA